MRYFIICSFLILPFTSPGQSIDSLQTEIDKLSNNLAHYNQKIDSLEDKRNKIDSKISALKQQIEKIRLEKKQEKGITAKLSAKGKIRDKPAVYGDVIAEPLKGDEIQIYSLEKEQYFKAAYNGKIGYISHTYLDKSDYITEALKDAKPQLTRLSKRFGKGKARRLLNGDIWIGMTDEMARISIGSPEDINRSTYSWGVHEQWVYPDGKYLYFENGELTSWQE